jgi:hypothetical protein
MELEGSYCVCKSPGIGHYPEPDVSSPHPHEKDHVITKLATICNYYTPTKYLLSECSVQMTSKLVSRFSA